MRGELEIIGAGEFVGHDSGNIDNGDLFGGSHTLVRQAASVVSRLFRSWSAQRRKKDGRTAGVSKRRDRGVPGKMTTAGGVAGCFPSGPWHESWNHGPWTTVCLLLSMFAVHIHLFFFRCLLSSWSANWNRRLFGVVRNHDGKGRYTGLCSGTNRAISK